MLDFLYSPVPHSRQVAQPMIELPPLTGRELKFELALNHVIFGGSWFLLVYLDGIAVLMIVVDIPVVDLTFSRIAIFVGSHRTQSSRSANPCQAENRLTQKNLFAKVQRHGNCDTETGRNNSRRKASESPATR